MLSNNKEKPPPYPIWTPRASRYRLIQQAHICLHLNVMRHPGIQLIQILAFLACTTTLAPSLAFSQPAYKVFRINALGIHPSDFNDSGWVLTSPGSSDDNAPIIVTADSQFVDFFDYDSLDGFDGWTVHFAAAFNNTGQVCGAMAKFPRNASTDLSSIGFLSSGSSVSQLLPINSGDIDGIGFENCEAFDVNSTGTVVGRSTWRGPLFDQPDFWTPDRAAKWSGGGPGTHLEIVAGYRDSYAYAINNAGTAVGFCQTPTDPMDGLPSSTQVMWQGNSPTELGIASGGAGGRPHAINSNGWIVGSALFPVPVGEFSTPHAYLWRDGQYTDLNRVIHGSRSVAVSINDSGQVAGNYENPINRDAVGVFLWEDGTTYWLDSLIATPKYENETGNFLDSRRAIAINNKGDILTQSEFGFVYNLYRRVVIKRGIVVNSVGDDGDSDLGDGECSTGNTVSGGDPECTLRAAIEHANATAGLDTIFFNIPSAGMPTISPLSTLPSITEEVTIDGTSQSGGHVEISGASLGSAKPSLAEGDGLIVTADNCRIEGLVINRFSGNGLVIQNSDSTEVYRMIIGSTPDSSDEVGNGGHGILITASSHSRIGDSFFSFRNLIAYNKGAGVFVTGNVVGNTIRRNTIVGNGGLGIDLAPEGVTLNDSADLDTGPNSLANYPVIDSTTGPDSNPRVWGTMFGDPQTVWLVELFINNDCDTLGFGEGKRSIASTVVNMNGSTCMSFDTPLTAPLGENQLITATATDNDGSTSEFSRCWPSKFLEIVDANDQPIPNKEFLLYKIRNDRPTMTETLVDTIMTDAEGLAPIRGGEIVKGDSIKVYRMLHRVPTKKLHGKFGAAYSIHLDNAHFDSLLFHMNYDEFDSTQVQKIKLDHTTLAYNLFVSIEWDVSLAYLDSLKQGFRNMANYMYDVCDGQVRFDTISIVDEKADWVHADIQVLADNTYESEATRWGLLFGPPLRSAAMRTPRRWYGNSDLGRNMSVTEQPLNPAAVTNYRMLAHEFGHLGMGFLDEYQYAGFTGRCRSLMTWYGFMESYYVRTNESARRMESTTEMSWSRQYSDGSCRNSRQYDQHNASCWDFFETSEERVYDGILAPIIKPDERNLGPLVDFFEGPNQGGVAIAFDVGALVEFTGTIPAQTRKNRLAITRDFIKLKPLPGVRVRQVITSPARRYVKQGRTADDGRIVLLGVAQADILQVAGGGFFTDNKRESVGSGAEDAIWYSATLELDGGDGDLTVELNQVAGSYPLIAHADLSGAGIQLTLSGSNLFLEDPTVETNTLDGALYSDDFSSAGTVYTATISDDPDLGGFFTVWAVDDSLDPFFFDVDYTNAEFEDTITIYRITSQGGDASFSWGDLTVDRALLSSTDYPVLRSGLDAGSEHAGRSQALSVDSDSDPEEGYFVTIYYADSDVADGAGIYGNELTIRIFQWSDGTSEWEMVGGTVDTVINEVTVTAETAGLFAAFTTDADVIPPATTIGVLQNPLLPSYLDLFVLVDEPLVDLPVLTANDVGLVIESTADGTAPTYSAKYELNGAESVTLRAVTTDLALNVTEAMETFESFPAGKSGAFWNAGDGHLQLNIPKGALDRDHHLLLFTERDNGEPVYDLKPSSLRLARSAELRIDAGETAKSRLDRLVIARREPGGAWVSLPTVFDDATGMLVSEIDRLGAYQVRMGARGELPRSPLLMQNTPNPFNATTSITFALPEKQHVKLQIFNILGQRVVLLLDEPRDAGRHTVTWNGHDRNDREIVSGVYLYRIQTDGFAQTKRMVLLK